MPVITNIYWVLTYQVVYLSHYVHYLMVTTQRVHIIILILQMEYKEANLSKVNPSRYGIES